MEQNINERNFSRNDLAFLSEGVLKINDLKDNVRIKEKILQNFE